MSLLGQMVRAGSSAPMKLIRYTGDGAAECIWIDGNGVIRRRYHHVDQLTPLWMSLGPKSLWPDMTQLDLVAIEKEERQAAAARRAARKASRKSRRSNKIKSRTVA